MKIDDLLGEYRAYLEQEKQLAPNTIRGYLADLRELAGVVPLDVEDITVKDLRAYVRHLSQKGRARRTVLRKMHGLTSFWEWLYINGSVTRVIPPMVPVPGKPPRQIPRILSVPDLKVFAETEGETPAQTAAFRLLAWLGLRPNELITLTVERIDLEKSTVHITGKGNHERLLVMPGGLRDELAALIDARPAGGWLFPSINGKGTHWSRNGFNDAFQRHLARCDLAGRGITPYWLRHSFVTHMIDAGVPPHVVSRLAGHTRLETTMIYVHTAQAQLDAAMKKHVLR